MRKSKYLNNTFGNWTCTHIGIANVQNKRSKSPGTRNYYYIFERITSDKKAMKLIRLNSTEASQVYKGISVETLVEKRKPTTNSIRANTYNFIDRV